MGLVKTLLATALVIGVAVWTLSTVELELFQPPQYQPNPQEDVALFQSFIDANIDKKSDDPYISSTVKPEDDLYPFLVRLQYGQYDGETLEKLMKEDNADAIYWFARMDLINTKARRKNFTMLDNMAQKGLPYAAWTISAQNYFCSMFLGSATIISKVAQELGQDTQFEKKACSREYLDLAITLAKQRAAQGDLRSQYFLLTELTQDGRYISKVDKDHIYHSNYYNLNHSKQTRERFLNEAIRFAEQHYYQPLMDYIDVILFRPKGSSEFTSETPEHYQLAVNLLTIAANHNYLPALTMLAILDKNTLDKDDPIYLKLLKLGSDYYFFSRSYYFEDEYTPREQYIFALVFKEIAGSESYLRKVKYTPTSPQDERDLDKQAQALLKGVTPMVYIDNYTRRDDWSNI